MVLYSDKELHVSINDDNDIIFKVPWGFLFLDATTLYAYIMVNQESDYTKYDFFNYIFDKLSLDSSGSTKEFALCTWVYNQFYYIVYDFVTPPVFEFINNYRNFAYNYSPDVIVDAKIVIESLSKGLIDYCDTHKQIYYYRSDLNRLTYLYRNNIEDVFSKSVFIHIN